MEMHILKSMGGNFEEEEREPIKIHVRIYAFFHSNFKYLPHVVIL